MNLMRFYSCFSLFLMKRKILEKEERVRKREKKKKDIRKREREREKNSAKIDDNYSCNTRLNTIKKGESELESRGRKLCEEEEVSETFCQCSNCSEEKLFRPSPIINWPVEERETNLEDIVCSLTSS